MTQNDAENAIKIAAEIAAMEVTILMEISKAIAIKIHDHEWRAFVCDIYRFVTERYDEVIIKTIKEIERKNNVN